MSKPSRFTSALYNTEAAWGDSSTNTYGTRLQLLEPPQLNLNREMVGVPQSQQYAEQGVAHLAGPYTGSSFTIKLGLTGHGAATTGALTATDLYTLLTNFLGNGNADAVGDTIASATSAIQFADAGSFAGNSYDLIRVGDRDDARGNGQCVAVNNASTITLLTALDATPNASDQIYAMLNVFPDENPGSLGTITSTRWQLMSANQQYRCWGCFPMGMAFSGLNHGEVPAVELTYGVSHFDETNQTFPDTTATDAKDLSPITMGSCFIQDVGTTTRQTKSLRSWNLNINMNTVPLMGTGGYRDGQIIVGAVRERCSASFSLTLDADAAGTQFFADIAEGETLQHVLLTLGSGQSGRDGKYLGFYFPNARMVNRPIQEDGDGINRQTAQFEALTSTTTTNAGTLASWRLAMG